MTKVEFAKQILIDAMKEELQGIIASGDQGMIDYLDANSKPYPLYAMLENEEATRHLESCVKNAYEWCSVIPMTNSIKKEMEQ